MLLLLLLYFLMMGYYKNPQATAEAFTEDGWFRTQDLGFIDEKGWLSIRGRLKNMILGPSGENIYPEEIETVINSHSSIVESLVTTLKGNLIAKVHPNPDMLVVYNQKKEELHKAYMAKKAELIAEYEVKKAELIAAYSNKKAEVSASLEQASASLELKKHEFAVKKSEFAKAYDEKRRELYRVYAEKRDEATAAYNTKKNEMIESISSSFDSLKKEVAEYVNARVNKFSKITDIYIQHEAFQKTATSKIKRYLYN